MDESRSQKVNPDWRRRSLKPAPSRTDSPRRGRGDGDGGGGGARLCASCRFAALPSVLAGPRLEAALGALLKAAPPRGFLRRRAASDSSAAPLRISWREGRQFVVPRRGLAF